MATIENKIRNHGIGPGGWACACCAPAPGKDRKAWNRRAKKRAKRFAMKEAKAQIPE